MEYFSGRLNTKTDPESKDWSKKEGNNLSLFCHFMLSIYVFTCVDRKSELVCYGE
jgi:hypothetical protein